MAGKGMKPQHGRNMRRWYQNFPKSMGPKENEEDSTTHPNGAGAVHGQRSRRDTGVEPKP